MKVVWSLWSKPLHRSGPGNWTDERYHLYAWTLSVGLARRYYADTWLITDDEGARLLVDRLGLEFARVSTDLNALSGYDPGLWALGKLYAYRAQTEPFVHLDSDVFLWEPLPERLERAAVFTQSPEPFVPGSSTYRPERLEQALRMDPGAWFPEEWSWYRRARHGQRGECCGILGGVCTDFITYYADLALRLVDHPANQAGWRRAPDQGLNMILIEQYLLAACVEYHRRRAESPFAGIDMVYLFDQRNSPFYPPTVSRVRYTHLLGDTKRRPELLERLSNRVQREFPDLYERCGRVVSHDSARR